MKTISQVSIFIENTKGRLAEVCGLLGDNNINIKALTIAETPEFGILRVVLNDTEKAKCSDLIKHVKVQSTLSDT